VNERYMATIVKRERVNNEKEKPFETWISSAR